MEPDIIRLYSSSPPPLDNGAEDDDDEFGEFGGFSEVNSSVGFADFDATDYSNSKEDFIPPNHFLPIHGYSDVNSISSTKTDKDCFAETSDSTLGQSEVLETITCNETIQSRTSNSPFDGRASPDNIRTKVQEKEHFVRQECISPEVISPEVNVSNQEISNCNGEKVCSLEILTNGFAVLDSVNPQGIEYLDFDSDSKGLKTISTHSTAPSFESRPNPSGVFADVTTFSNTNTVQLEVMEQKACRELGDAEVPKSQDNHVINRVDERSTAKSVSYPGTCENEEQSELEPEQVGISEDSAALEGEDQLEQNPMSWDCETVVGSSTLPTSLKSERNWGSENVGGEEKGEAKNAARRTVSINASRTYGSTETINDSQRINEDELGQVQAVSSVPTKIVSLSEFEGVTNGDLGSENAAFPSTDKDDLGMVVSVMPPSTGETLESNGCKASETTSEQLPQFSESGGEFGDFGNLSTDSHPEFIAFESKKKQSWDALSDPCGADSKFPDFPVRPFAHVDEEEFGDFDSMPKTRDGRDTFQDFDDFADFSSASCSQAGEWNAFEDEQKGSTWAAFGDEQAVDSFSNEEEPWQPHRTEVPVASDIDQSIKDSVWPTSHTTESTVYCQDSTAPPQTSLLGRLERIFQVCFPAIPVPEVEETIPTLKSLLEKGEKQGKEQAKSGDSSANSGQLLDVWMALQDIHDGYGLKYQWGGSHSNKKLLCSLGIDTRNISCRKMEKFAEYLPAHDRAEFLFSLQQGREADKQQVHITRDVTDSSARVLATGVTMQRHAWPHVILTQCSGQGKLTSALM